MHARRTVLAVAVALSVVVPVVGSAPSVSAHDDGHRLRVKVVARGLDNPRGLAVRNNGDLFIAQAGRGGAGPCFVGAEGPTCLGATGKVSKLRHGHVRDIVTGLPSLGLQGTGNNAIGPTDVTFDRSGRLFATIGLAFDPAVITRPTLPYPPGGLGGSDLARQLATVVKVDRHKGTVRQVANIGAFEQMVNPDGGLIDTNPNSLVASGRRLVVADAGGNALPSVRRNGKVRALAVFQNEAPVPNPFPPPETIAPQPVPDSVVRGPDGAFYVGQLTGFPFVNGTATVFRVVPGKAPTVFADGFTNIIDIAFTRRGDLLVLEIAKDGLFGPLILGNGDWDGALKLVKRKHGKLHTRTLLETPLFAPGGMAVRGDTLYISNRTVFAGDGQILKVRLHH